MLVDCKILCSAYCSYDNIRVGYTYGVRDHYFITPSSANSKMVHMLPDSPRRGLAISPILPLFLSKI